MTTPMTREELLRDPQYIVEGIILRRLHEKRIEGYTLAMAKEIAAALDHGVAQQPTPTELEAACCKGLAPESECACMTPDWKARLSPDATVVSSTERAALSANERLMPLLDLPPAEQYDIAFKLAENVGYVLAREPEHPDSPHVQETESVSHYVENYRFEFDDGRQYTPNEQDKALLEDALEGYLAVSSNLRGEGK